MLFCQQAISAEVACFAFLQKRGSACETLNPVLISSHYTSDFQLKFCTAILLATGGFLVVGSRFGFTES